MTTSTPATTVSHKDPRPVQTTVPAQRPATIQGRPRSVPGEEAYERSAREQAAIDIAGGW